MASENLLSNIVITDEEALEFHRSGTPGKILTKPSKNLVTQRDLALAYSPGVAVPCMEIVKDPSAIYEYTARGNFVAVITNGTAVLGLGNIGAAASKPVMEGKAVLFKRFADIDAIDLEIDTEDVEEFINAVKYTGKTWGGINLEDIKAPECFVIEKRLQELMEIPVFHDDQHGTAIISAAALINAVYLTNRKLSDTKIVVNGAGAAAIACLNLFVAMGVSKDNIILCDSKGVIFSGRKEGMNEWKENFATKSNCRSLNEALKEADVFLGLSVKGAMTKEMVSKMAKNPIIFAMANPDPEILPSDVSAVRDDAIIATGRSDFANQVNNVMCFPYIFRGALDVRASCINMEMKIAAAKSLAELARKEVPVEVSRAYSGRKMSFGKDYIIPVPFDPRLLSTVSLAVAKAAIDSGVAAKVKKNFQAYEKELSQRTNPAANFLNLIYNHAASNLQRILFAEGEEKEIIRAAVQMHQNGYGKPILVGREDRIQMAAKAIGMGEALEHIEITNAAVSKNLELYTSSLYKKMQRSGFLHRDCDRLIKSNRNIFAASMLKHGGADGMVTGLNKGFYGSLSEVRQVIGNKANQTVFAFSLIISKQHNLIICDTAINPNPTPAQLADIATQAAHLARKIGYDPKVALLSSSNFGNNSIMQNINIKDAVDILDSRNVDFEYDGEMMASVALDHSWQQRAFPFCRLTGPANVLVMPTLNASNIASQLSAKIAESVLVGPIISGLEKSVQIMPLSSSASDILNFATFTANNSIFDIS